MIVLAALALVLLGGFVMYPRAMFGLLGSLLRGLMGLLADGLALVLAWI